MGKKLLALILACSLALCGCTDKKVKDNTVDKDQDSNTITVWMDKENERYVRQKVSGYIRSGIGSAKWELVDKSYLTAGQYRKELLEALEAGSGPDLIYMDTCNGVDPLELLEGGYLAGIADMDEHAGTETAYLPGMAEAGERGGKCYVLPIFMECPVLFGVRGDLEAAGLKTEGMYASLEDLLEALLAAQQKDGRLVLQNGSLLDWLERYYMPKDGAQAGRIKELLEELRGRCGSRSGTFAAYEGITRGECLLGSGTGGAQEMTGSFFLFPKGQDIVCIGVPDCSGDVSAVVTHAVGISSAGRNQQLAQEAVVAFRQLDIDYPGLPALDDDGHWEQMMGVGALALSIGDYPVYYARVMEQGDFPERTGESFLDCTRRAAVCAGYAASYGSRDSLQEDVPVQGYDVLSLYYASAEEQGALTGALQEAADLFAQENEGYWASLVHSYDDAASEMYRFDLEAGVAADMGLFKGKWGGFQNTKDMDLTELLEEHRSDLGFLPEGLRGGVMDKGKPCGLAVRAEKYGMYCRRGTLQEAGLGEDWDPQDMDELADGLQALKRVAGTAGVLTEDDDALRALALFASPDALKQQEDGSWRQSKEAWVQFTQEMLDWRSQGLIEAALAKGDGLTEAQAMQGLLDGSVGAVFCGSHSSQWYRQPGGLEASDAQTEELVFIQLGHAVGADVLYISAEGGRREAAFCYWLTLMHSPGYADGMKQDGYLPVTELSEEDYVIPYGEAFSSRRYCQALMEGSADAGGLAESTAWYEWADE